MQSTKEIRGFNWFYTAKLGPLSERYPKNGYTIAMHKIASERSNGATTATRLTSDLMMDKAQASRILARMLSIGVVEKTADTWNAKRQLIKLTDHGRAVRHG